MSGLSKVPVNLKNLTAKLIMTFFKVFELLLES